MKEFVFVGVFAVSVCAATVGIAYFSNSAWPCLVLVLLIMAIKVKS